MRSPLLLFLALFSYCYSPFYSYFYVFSSYSLPSLYSSFLVSPFLVFVCFPSFLCFIALSPFSVLLPLACVHLISHPSFSYFILSPFYSSFLYPLVLLSCRLFLPFTPICVRPLPRLSHFLCFSLLYSLSASPLFTTSCMRSPLHFPPFSCFIL